MKKYILAIDQGTTGNRAIIYDKDAGIVASSYQEFHQYFPKPGWVEHNPREIWKSVLATIQNVLKKVPKDSIAAIGITNQRETSILWERKTGKPVYNAIVWQCRRTAKRCDALKKEKGLELFFRRRTGLPIDAYFSGTKIEWIFKNISGAFTKAKNGKLLFGTTDSWLLWKLTGGKVHATDYTNASRTLLFDINRLQWDDSILKKFGIPKKVLPQVKNSSSVYGATIRIKNLPAGIPISGIAGDQQAALFGQACFQKGEMKNTYGTGSFILLNTGKRKPVSKHGLITTLGCGHRGEPVYVLEGAIFIAGAALQWLRDGLRILPNASLSEGIAQSVNDTGGVYFVPAFVGLGAPYWDQNARGMICGITRGTTQAHLIRAALEALCYQTKDVLGAMQKDTGLKLKSLKVDGGAANNNFLCQFQSNILGIDVIRPQRIETTSLGAAYLAGLSIGYWKNSNEIKKHWKKDKMFRPHMSKITSTNLYRGWREAMNRARSRSV